MAKEWSEFNQFSEAFHNYLPISGEGETKATQIATAVSKLVYKWFNDGDVFDNMHYLTGWANDLSSYANWLFQNVPETQDILPRIADCYDDSDYEDLLYDLCEATSDREDLENWDKQPKQGTIYDCEGQFRFEEYPDEEEDDENEWW